ncbi:hypothetical protein FCV25MIE_27543 [Fagus crenata]
MGKESLWMFAIWVAIWTWHERGGQRRFEGVKGGIGIDKFGGGDEWGWKWLKPKESELVAVLRVKQCRGGTWCVSSFCLIGFVSFSVERERSASLMAQTNSVMADGKREKLR